MKLVKEKNILSAGIISKITFIITVIISVIFIFFPCLYAKYDNSLRIDQNLYGTIDERFQFIFYSFQQFDKDVSEYDYFEIGTGLQYQTIISWLSFLLYYQQSYSKCETDSWSLEKKPSININTSVIIFAFKLSDQIRYEYRIKHEWQDYRIKNNLTVSLYDIFLHPYTGWELYYENHDKDIMLNRFKFGISNSIYRSISLGTYYRIDFSNVDNQWEFTRQLTGFQIILKY